VSANGSAYGKVLSAVGPIPLVGFDNMAAGGGGSGASLGAPSCKTFIADDLNSTTCPFNGTDVSLWQSAFECGVAPVAAAGRPTSNNEMGCPGGDAVVTGTNVDTAGAGGGKIAIHCGRKLVLHATATLDASGSDGDVFCKAGLSRWPERMW
jgi:hypothetical protein